MYRITKYLRGWVGLCLLLIHNLSNRLSSLCVLKEKSLSLNVNSKQFDNLPGIDSGVCGRTFSLGALEIWEYLMWAVSLVNVTNPIFYLFIISVGLVISVSWNLWMLNWHEVIFLPSGDRILYVLLRTYLTLSQHSLRLIGTRQKVPNATSGVHSKYRLT